MIQRIPAPLAASFALLSLGGALDVELAPQLAAEETRTLTYHHESDVSLTDMQVLVNGEDGGGPDGMEQEMSNEFDLVVSDRILTTEDGRALSLERTFVTASGSDVMEMVDPMGGDHSQESSMTTELEGKSVVLSLDDGDVTAEWAEGESGDDDLLADLRFHLDYSEFLPSGPVAEGDSWDIDLEFIDLFEEPAGDLHLSMDGADGSEMTQPEAEPDSSGTVEATLSGFREEDGRRMAVIAVSIDIAMETDLTEAMKAMEDSSDHPEGGFAPEIESMEERMEYIGEGEALWDVEAGRLVSLSVECDIVNTQTMLFALSMEGQELEIEQEMSFEGTASWEIEIDA